MGCLALFDLDGTLVDRDTAFTEAVAAFCTDFGLVPEAQAWMLTELAERAHPEDMTRMRRDLHLVPPAWELWHAYVTRMAAAVSCRSAVRAGLAELRAAGWMIGIVTNGSGDIQRAKIRATGLAELVDGVTISGDAGVRKPDPALFHLAAEHCGADLSRAVMTGDNPVGDIGGGQRAGLRTIWLRGRPWPDGLPAADHTVDDVLDAVAILLADHQE